MVTFKVLLFTYTKCIHLTTNVIIGKRVRHYLVYPNQIGDEVMHILFVTYSENSFCSTSTAIYYIM